MNEQIFLNGVPAIGFGGSEESEKKFYGSAIGGGLLGCAAGAIGGGMLGHRAANGVGAVVGALAGGVVGGFGGIVTGVIVANALTPKPATQSVPPSGSK